MVDELAPYEHRYIQGTEGGLPITLLLLHGTGGDETSMLPVARALAPGTNVLTLRGNVSEGGAARFFRRFAPGVLDEADLRERARELAAFLPAAAAHYGFDPGRIVAAGYSNGANMAAALLLLHPGVLAGAVLLRAQVPLMPQQQPDLAGTPVFVAAGRYDTMVPGTESERLAGMLQAAGADVTLEWQDRDHTLDREEIRRAAGWLVEHWTWQEHPEPDSNSTFLPEEADTG